MTYTGLFITVEGGEGAGKSTLIKGLQQKLEHDGYRVVSTREPGGIDIAEQIRAVILDKRNTAMDERTEALLYAAARRQHLVEKVLPALQQGAIVLCDRFIDSSLAYQGVARGLGVDAVYEINRFATDGAMPDATLYLDIDPTAGLKRVHADAAREVNRLDLERLTFHKQVRAGYMELLVRFPERIVQLNAEQPRQQLVNSAYFIVKDRIFRKFRTD